MAAYPVRLTFPLPPDRANARLHWRTALREKKAYWRTLNLMEMTGHLPKPPRSPIVPARIAAHLYLHNHMDDDNAMARLKILVDWLQGAWIGTDRRGDLQWEGMPEQTIDRRNPRVVVTLTEAG